MAKNAGIFILSDEVYEKLVYEGAKHFSIGSLKSVRDQVITINGASMAFAMSGWRIGYMGGPPSVISAAAKLQSLCTFGPNSVAQHAAATALTGPTGEREAMLAEFTRRRDYAVESLTAIRDVKVVLPEGAFFVFFDIRRFLHTRPGKRMVRNSLDLATFLLEDHHVVTSPGVAFGDDGCLRISLAHPMAELERGMKRLKTGLGEL